MNDLRKAAEMALEFVEWLCSDDHSVKPKNNALKTREALRQALDDKPAVKSYCGGKPNYTTPVDAVPGFTVTEPRQSLSRMKPGDRFVLVRTGEICRIKNDGSQWNETAQRPSRFHKNSQVRLIVDAVNMTPDRVDETAKGKHEPVAWLDSEGRFSYFKHLDSDEPLYTAPPVSDYHEGWEEGFKAAKRDSSSWVGLTDEEIYDYADKFLYQHGSNYGIRSFGKAIEAKLKEKNS